jgi:RNA polymerase sigma factor (sigma-70 family)
MSLFRTHQDLLPRFRKGDREALSAVYWHYVDVVESVIRRGFFLASTGQQVPGSHASEVADLAQDVFVRVFSESGRMGFDGIREFKPYLVTIARNVLIDWRRKRRPEQPWDGLDEERLSAPAASPTDPAWADPEMVRIVEVYIAGLPPELARIHHCRYVANLSQYEAAKSLGLSRQQVRTLEQRLQSGLAQAIEREKKQVDGRNLATQSTGRAYGRKEERP